jgi:hypothetical protein
MSTILNNQVTNYYQARLEYEKAKRESNRLEELWRAEEQKLIDAMLDANVKSVTLADGSKPSLTRSCKVKCTKDNATAVRSWLCETVGSDDDFIETLPNRFKVAAYVKKQIENGADEATFPPFLEVSTRPSIRVYGWKNAAGEVQNDE